MEWQEMSAHLEGERSIQPVMDDSDIPLDIRRALMRAAVANGRISYLWLCAVYRHGVADGHDPLPHALEEGRETKS